MKPLELEDLRPEPITFTLWETGDKVHTFRLITIADQKWIKENLGKPFQELFKTGNEIPFADLARIWLNQLVDASPFEPENRKVKDRETGREEEVFITGSQKLMEAVATQEFDRVMDAFYRCIARSRVTPALAEAVSGGQEKKAMKAAKSVGPSSSTRSAKVTAGLGTTSGH
jgi:hypothetical protein